MNSTNKIDSFKPFSYKFSSRHNPTKRFEIRPFTEEDVEQVLDQLCTSFAEGEPLGHYLGVTKEMWESQLRPSVLRCVEENLGVACVDVETGKLAVTVTSYDVSNAIAQPFFLPSKYQALDEIIEMTAVDQDPSLKSEKFNDVVFLFCLACSKEYQGLGLAKDTVQWILKNHPIMSKSKAITITATNPKTKIIMDKTGWETTRVLNLIEYKNKKGEYIFESITEEFERVNFLKGYKEIHFGVYRPEKDANQ